jgi:hypothetical protein
MTSRARTGYERRGKGRSHDAVYAAPVQDPVSAAVRRAAQAAVLVAVLACSAWNGWIAWSRISLARGVLFSGQLSPEIEKRAQSSLRLVEREEISRAVGAEVAILIVGTASFALVRLSRRKSRG